MSAASAGADRPLLGVLGGMGPAATADFLRKLVAATPARRDQDHLPVLVSSVPQIPDRTRAFLGQGESPLQALVTQGRRLVAAGAQVLAMPCNTAHLWFDPLQAALDVPMLHIVDAALDALGPRPAAGGVRHVGLLATPAVLRSGLYPARGAQRHAADDIAWHLPSAREVDTWVAPGIAAVKAGDLAAGRAHLHAAASALCARGAQALVLGCTEIPLVLRRAPPGVRRVDATQALADAAVRWVTRHAQRPAVA